MEDIVGKGHGLDGLLAGLIIVLCLHLVTKLAHFIWELNKKKQEVTEDAINNLSEKVGSLMHSLITVEERMRALDTKLDELNKFKLDIRQLISAIKELAGDRWQDIRKIIIEDKFPT